MSREFACGITRAYLTAVDLPNFVLKCLHRIVDVYEADPLKASSLFDRLDAEFGLTDIHHRDCFSQVKNFLFKRSDEHCNKDALNKAISDFGAYETRCSQFFISPRDPDAIQIREIIFRIIGDFGEREWSEILDRSRPGSGQSIGLWNRFRSSKIHKLVACDYTCTPLGMLYGSALTARLAEEYLIGERKLRPVAGSKISFVPKNIKTFRTIATEPNINMQLQLGVHEFLVPRLLRVGVNLRDQGVNQNLARHASIFDDFATVDFSAASDTISDSLVYALLPRSWYLFLNSIRSQVYTIDGNMHRLSKFVTMGNGYTFALESLIFYAIARYVCGPGCVISVFGDDVILPSKHYDRFFELATKLGLLVNNDKSFSSGPFRESCGTDWWRGICVTPLRLQEEVVTAQTCYRFINNWGKRPSGKPVRDYIISYLKNRGDRVLYGLANELDDSCIFTTFDYAKGGGWLRYHKRYQTWIFKGLTTKGVHDTVYSDDWRYLAAKLYGAADGEVSYQLKDCQTTVERNLTAGVHLRTQTYRAQGLDALTACN